MAVQVIAGDIFKSDCRILVNPVNCKGAMGKGLALQFKTRYPDMYRTYKKRCDKSLIRMGHPDLWAGGEHWVVNFPTKFHWKEKADYGWITIGLVRLGDLLPVWGVDSIALPALGCGQGGLNWSEIEPIMFQVCLKWDAHVEIYEPADRWDHRGDPQGWVSWADYEQAL